MVKGVGPEATGACSSIHRAGTLGWWSYIPVDAVKASRCGKCSTFPFVLMPLRDPRELPQRSSFGLYWEMIMWALLEICSCELGTTNAPTMERNGYCTRTSTRLPRCLSGDQVVATDKSLSFRPTAFCPTIARTWSSVAALMVPHHREACTLAGGVCHGGVCPHAPGQIPSCRERQPGTAERRGQLHHGGPGPNRAPYHPVMSRISMFVVTQIFTWVALGQAGIVQILEPNDTYRAATTKIEISALEFNSQHEFITDGTLRVTFSFPMLKRGPVPTGWTTQAQLVYFGVKGGVPLTDVVGGTSALQEDRLQRFPDRFWHHFDGPGTRELLGISDAGASITCRLCPRPGRLCMADMSAGTFRGSKPACISLAPPLVSEFRSTRRCRWTHPRCSMRTQRTGSQLEPGCAWELGGSIWLLKSGTRAGAAVRSMIREQTGSSCSPRRIRWSCWSA